MSTTETRSRSGSAATAYLPSAVAINVPPVIGTGGLSAVSGARVSVGTTRVNEDPGGTVFGGVSGGSGLTPAGPELRCSQRRERTDTGRARCGERFA